MKMLVSERERERERERVVSCGRFLIPFLFLAIQEML